MSTHPPRVHGSPEHLERSTEDVMQPRWEDMTKPLRRTCVSDGVHAIAMKRHLAWTEDFARAGDLASAIDALGDATALAQELGLPVEGAGVGRL
jgi:hypothetical protein